ncbi:SDR family NAD(P)-dependent oxidoreductase [Actinophytocola oryzae]|uniref:Acyl transferase domain-containing protein n=1 Tax=Actinophytocola oryzae TaxID=502181 RepID=A0A4V3FT39_9PSEU|nr:type I polyketide synthase [Actinophytocola oryzae]TDV49791.1 acyl transferase domain-containing protein [Actinophytocola oryzae]
MSAVAVVGMACRFPGAPDLDTYWANLRDGVESIEPVRSAEGRVGAAPRFEGIEDFDAEFFGYTVREAETMDPQHRLFLETAWAALEHAGCDPTRHPAPIGVFGGAGTNHYLAHVRSHADLVAAIGRSQVLLGNELGFLATRVSYKLGLTGPSLSLRTACSTSLVALHLAVRSLRDGECGLALAGGVYLDADQRNGYEYLEGSFVSPDGHVRPFDADARGTVFGSGVGVVALKRLADALADGDTVHAVVRGSAVNNDGAVKVGFTAPSVTGQAAVITAALADACLDPADIDYVEAHGTGTALGDPIEVAALRQAFGGRGSCAIGSVKGNIGHLDAAAGMAGLIKTVLALRHELLPATLNFRRPNPALPLDDGTLRIQAETAPWPRVPGAPRRAGVSAFGFGGTNAHVVLEEAPGTPPVPDPGDRQLLVLSARSQEALETATDRLADHLDRHRPDLADVAHTLATGRTAFAHRRVLVTATGSATEAASALRSRGTGETGQLVHGHCAVDTAPVVFLFPGQGAQHVGMGRGLYDTEPVYRDAVDQCAQLLAPLLDADIRDVLYRPGHGIDDTRLTQPALFVTEYALVALLAEWGVAPSVMVGHSLGELVAATVAGVFTLPDALTVTAHRAALMREAPPGAMLGVATGPEQLELSGELSLAGHNSPRDCVVSGPVEHVTAFAERLRARGLTVRPLLAGHAFHHPSMGQAAEKLYEHVAARSPGEPTVPIVSTVTGEPLTGAQATDPAYWTGQITSPVRFHDAVLAAATPSAAFVEIGPGNTLTTLARRTLAAVRTTGTPTVVATLPHPDDPRADDATTARRAVGALWTAGAVVDWARHHGPHRRVVALPGHPLRRRRFWLDRRATPPAEAAGSAPSRRDDVREWFTVPSWRQAPLPRNDGPDTTAHWLVLARPTGPGADLAAGLRAAGARVSVVRPGSGWAADEDDYTVDPRRPAELDRLLDGLRDASGGGLPTHVVHAWTLDEPCAPTTGAWGELPPAEAAADADVLGFASLLLLARALNRHGDPVRRLWVVTNGLYRVTGPERTAPLKATLLGPARVLPREVPGLTCRVVDLDQPGPPVVARLLTELGAEPGPGAPDVAWRGAGRWTRHHEPHPLVPHEGPSPVRENGVYLVTGGTGGLGLALADHLTSAGARVVLVGRSPLPAEDGPVAGRDAGVAARLRARGDRVLSVTADVTDPDAVRGAVTAATDRWGAVHGAFHLAGVAGGGIIALKDLDTARTVLSPKVVGTLVLAEALAGQPLDFMVLFGSNGANVGSAGQVDYCAANCFLDAVAHAVTTTRVLTVDWGSWKGVGMAVTTALPEGVEQARRRDVATLGMSVSEGMLALDTVLARAAVPQVTVSPVPVDHLVAAAAPAAPDDAPRARALPGQDAVQVVRDVFGELLGVDDVGPDDGFFELGGNSLVAIQIVRAVNDRLAATLTVADLFEAGTAARLAPLAAPTPPAAGQPDQDRGGERRRDAVRMRRAMRAHRRTTKERT